MHKKRATCIALLSLAGSIQGALASRADEAQPQGRSTKISQDSDSLEQLWNNAPVELCQLVRSFLPNQLEQHLLDTLEAILKGTYKTEPAPLLDCSCLQPGTIGWSRSPDIIYFRGHESQGAFYGFIYKKDNQVTASAQRITRDTPSTNQGSGEAQASIPLEMSVFEGIRDWLNKNGASDKIGLDLVRGLYMRRSDGSRDFLFQMDPSWPL